MIRKKKKTLLKCHLEAHKEVLWLLVWQPHRSPEGPEKTLDIKSRKPDKYNLMSCGFIILSQKCLIGAALRGILMDLKEFSAINGKFYYTQILRKFQTFYVFLFSKR